MKPLRVGAVGLGRLGKFHAETLAFHLRDAELAAVCSVTPNERAAAEESFPGTPVFANYERMLAEAALDAVVLSTPSDCHCAQIKMALAAGQHVFCEKPLGTCEEECVEVMACCRAHPNQVVMLGFMRRFDPSYREVKRRLDAGEIGRPMLVRSYSVDPAAAIDGALAYLPHSAGQFLDMAVHDFDLARWLLDSEPVSVVAGGGCYAHEAFAAHDDGDHVGAFLKFENQAMLFVFAGRMAAHGYQVETEVIGTEGSLRVGTVPQRNHVEILDGHGVRRLCSQGFLERFETAYRDELQAFVQCCLEGKAAPVTVEDGWCGTRIALAAQRAYRDDSLVRLPLTARGDLAK